MKKVNCILLFKRKVDGRRWVLLLECRRIYFDLNQRPLDQQYFVAFAFLVVGGLFTDDLNFIGLLFAVSLNDQMVVLDLNVYNRTFLIRSKMTGLDRLERGKWLSL